MEEDWGGGAFKIVTDKPTGKRPLGKPRNKCQENIRMGLKVGISMRNWIYLAQDRDYWRALVNMALNLWIP